MKAGKCSQFYYRENANGTMDSICLRCYLTAATAESEADLHEREAAHQCPDKEPSLIENARRVRRRKASGV
jgi:hypothetical protein